MHVNLAQEYDRTIELLESLQRRDDLPFGVLKEAVREKPYINDGHIEEISAVQKLTGEAGQFEADVKEASERGLSGREVEKRVAYEEESAIEDLAAAAESVEHFIQLKEEAVSKRKEFEQNGQSFEALVMVDNVIIMDTIARNLVYYFWESYSDLRVMAKRLKDQTGHDIFQQELMEIEEIPAAAEAVEMIKKEYGSPGNLNRRQFQAALEEKAQEIRANL